MLDLIKRLFVKAPAPRCLHPNGIERKWNLGDGTPMVSFRCPDCGERDSGHVHGDSWTAEEIAGG
jgi:predicted RNA-binding Zn-ribbon protein involved in translation (DUF1610 family)